jgi:surface antigen
MAATVAACATGSYHGPSSAPPQVVQPQAQYVPHPYSQCVPYARARSGVDLYGDAYRWWDLAAENGIPRTFSPTAGAVMVLQVGATGTRGHLAFVQRVVSNREIIVDHANWHGRGEVAVNVPVIDVSPNNDWSQVKVFWLETRQMGARTYPVQGFVLPSDGLGATEALF